MQEVTHGTVPRPDARQSGHVVRLGRLWACFVLLVSTAAVALPQDAVEAEADAPDASDAAVPVEPERDLFRTTLVQDIATSGFYELIAWIELLGLSTQGDRRALVERLYAYYGVTESDLAQARTAMGTDTGESPGERPSGGRPGADAPLVIDSATRTGYFSLDAVGERYVRLSGGVSVTLQDRDSSAVHRITADEIIFNQQQQTIAASGSVVYLLERSGTVERFAGNALTVAIDAWDGAFVGGSTTRERTIDGRRIDFTFSGDYITRSRDDVIVLEDGAITSSVADPPNYQIRARKIWVLAPGEWGLQSATLYVGRVPLLWFPFFFRPADRLFFNPSLGSNPRSGSYMQTTTYLAGAPEQEDSPFSLLQLADDTDRDAPRRVEGLFLVPDEGSEPAPAPGTTTLRLLADVYTKLGAYVALDGAVRDLGPLVQLDFTIALAASRNIYRYAYEEQGTTYSPLYFEDGAPTTSWNSFALGDLTVPLRYGLDLRGNQRIERGSLQLGIQHYSDHRFVADYQNRSERIDWIGLLTADPPTTGAPLSSLVWQASGAWAADTRALAPFLREARLQRAVATLRWGSREIPEDRLSPAVQAADDSPERRFFYPQSLRLPDLAMSFSGALLQLPGPRPVAEPPGVTDKPTLVAPWDAGTPEADPGDARAAPEAEPLRPPEPSAPAVEAALTSPSPPAPWDATVSYSLSPSLLVDYTFTDATWVVPQDVDFGIAYGGASARSSGALTYGTRVLSGMWSVNGSLSANAQYRTLFSRSDEVSDATWESLERQAWAFNAFSTTNTVTVRVLPLRAVSRLEKSSVSYQNSILLYQSVFSEVADEQPVYRSEVVRWDREYIRSHQVEVATVYSAAADQTLRLSASLPPLDERYAAQLALRFAPVSLAAASAVSLADQEWVFAPLTSTVTIEPRPALRLTNALSYNIESDEPLWWNRLTFNRTSFVAGPVTGQLELQTVPGAEWDAVNRGWTATDRRLRPTTASLAVRHAEDFEPLWRNRVVGSVSGTVGAQANLLRFTQSSLTFGLATAVRVHQFLALQFSASSANLQPYVYIGPLAEKVGRDRRSLVVDLARSFNFFNRRDREESAFNLQQISLSAVHALEDWDLSVSYSGRPQVVTEGVERPRYEWRAQLDVNVQWRPIREAGTRGQVSDESVTISSPLEGER